jgi:hypothetical protein
LFGYLTGMLVRYFEDSLGVPAALAVAGVLLLGLAVVSARLMRAVRPPSAPPPGPPEPPEPPVQPQEQDELHHVS